ncbi:hypothetical protein WJX77_010462 [Trebouxia sp. C0004]
MDADLSDEDFLLPSTQLNFPLKMPSLAQDVADAKHNSDRQDTGNRKTLDKFAPVHQAPFGNLPSKAVVKAIQARDTIWLKSSSSVRRRVTSQPDQSAVIAMPRSLMTVPVEVQEAEELQEISEPDVILRRRRMHVQADATTAGREDDMIQQLQEAGEEMQEDDSDAVLERCEQLSLS